MTPILDQYLCYLGTLSNILRNVAKSPEFEYFYTKSGSLRTTGDSSFWIGVEVVLHLRMHKEITY